MTKVALTSGGRCPGFLPIIPTRLGLSHINHVCKARSIK